MLPCVQDAEDLYGFLFRHFDEKRFWWEMLVLLRKLGFAAIIHQPKAPEQQTMLGILCLLPYIALVNGVRPYSSHYLNWMDMLGASFASSLALSGLIMFGGYDTQLDTDQVRRQARSPLFARLLDSYPGMEMSN